jgi:hypothetical protein
MTSKLTLFVFKILYTNWLVWFCEGLKSFKERIKNKKTKKKSYWVGYSTGKA